MPNLAEALSLVALMAATLQYAILIRHRKERRNAIRWQQTVRESLRAGRLVSQRRWRQDGSRFVSVN
ncbi:MAG TPA: hypothetical protein VH859_04540 [Candidatus Limnocylindria bacterium]|jgi:hypothetical protein